MACNRTLSDHHAFSGASRAAAGLVAVARGAAGPFRSAKRASAGHGPSGPAAGGAGRTARPMASMAATFDRLGFRLPVGTFEFNHRASSTTQLTNPVTFVTKCGKKRAKLRQRRGAGRVLLRSVRHNDENLSQTGHSPPRTFPAPGPIRRVLYLKRSPRKGLPFREICPTKGQGNRASPEWRARHVPNRRTSAKGAKPPNLARLHLARPIPRYRLSMRTSSA